MTDAGSVMWRSASPKELHMFDDQDWPAQPNSLPLPNAVLREASSVADVAAFMAIGEAWAQMVSAYLPANPRVLDVGCGCGKLARFFYLNPGLTYVGVDLYEPGILWCQKAFAGASDRFRFVHFDGNSEVYNAAGGVKASEYVFPLKAGEVDMTVCASLFTHLFEPDARHYLAEIYRVTKPGGAAIISIHVTPAEGTKFSGDEARIDIDPDYFASLCVEAGMHVEKRIGVIYGQTAFLLRKPAGLRAAAKAFLKRG